MWLRLHHVLLSTLLVYGATQQLFTPGSRLKPLISTEEQLIKAAEEYVKNEENRLHNSKATCPGLISRASWGAEDPKVPLDALPLPADYVFIHHTATPSCDSVDSCSRRVRSIQNYHMTSIKTNFGDIGYSFLVGGDGNIYEGRGWDTAGAHTWGWNYRGLAWAFIGDFTSEMPTQASIIAVQNAIACGVQRAKLTSSYTLRGHRDMIVSSAGIPRAKNTTCPGDTLYHAIQQWDNY